MQPLVAQAVARPSFSFCLTSYEPKFCYKSQGGLALEACCGLVVGSRARFPGPTSQDARQRGAASSADTCPGPTELQVTQPCWMALAPAARARSLSCLHYLQHAILAASLGLGTVLARFTSRPLVSLCLPQTAGDVWHTVVQGPVSTSHTPYGYNPLRGPLGASFPSCCQFMSVHSTRQQTKAAGTVSSRY
jgi:hypothetical protein